MLHDNINISRLMVHAQQVEESTLRRKNRESKRAKCSGSGSSKGKFRFNKRFSNQVPSKFPKAHDDRVSNPKLKREEVLVHQARSLLMESVARRIGVSV